MRITPLDWVSLAALLILAAAVCAVWVLMRGRPPGRHARGFCDCDDGTWEWGEDGPSAVLTAAPPLAPLPGPLPAPAENHADFFGVPAPKYTELDAWRAEEEAAERLAGTATQVMLAAIVRGLEYRDLIDQEAGLILERVLAQLTMADIAADLS